MKIGRIATAVFIYVLTCACQDAIQKPLLSEKIDLLVVEGTLTNENINHRITLSHPYQTLNGNPDPATGAIVSITEGGNVYPLSESPIGSGQYYTPVMGAVTGKTYTLFIQYQNQQYTAQDSPEPVESLQPLQYAKLNDLYELTLNPTGQEPNYISHDIAWTNTPSCASGSGCDGEIVYYDLKTFDVNEIFKPAKADFYFPVNSMVIRKKYSVSPAYKAFLRAVLSETEWSGGVFDVQHANAPTNLSQGAIGFFAVSTVVSDTTKIVEKP